MDNGMLWINEGFVLDEAGNLITTSYIDLRPPGDRTAIRTLIKGCRREHALEDSPTILISPVREFREKGKNLIRDEREGMATVEKEVEEPETPAELFQRRRLADVDEAVELLDSWTSVSHRRTSRRMHRSSGRVSFAKEWWIFSTSIRPETDEQWAAWEADIDPRYDHKSEIGQPAKFAQALARMVTEQLGPRGGDAWTRGSVGDGGDAALRTKHPAQQVLHGPIVYDDRLYETLTQEADEATRIAASMFTKREKHATLREYRFVILSDGEVTDTVSLSISGMMRDALPAGPSALVRPEGRIAAATASPEVSSSPTRGSTKLHGGRMTAKRRVRYLDTMRSERRKADGTVLSAETTERERVHEKTVKWDPSAARPAPDAGEAMDGRADGDSRGRQERPMSPDDLGPETTDEDAIREIAFTRPESREEVTESGAFTIMRGTGRSGGSLEEMFTKMFNDPASPMPASSESWAADKLGREEVLEIHGWMATLAHKVERVAIEQREAASSACWQAIQCIRNIYVRLGNIVDTVAIERQRFVVLDLKASAESRATGRIVVAPSGAYAYSLKAPNKGIVGHSDGEAGRIFPVVSLDEFESFGWSPKDD